jgi:hypothetical protein
MKTYRELVTEASNRPPRKHAYRIGGTAGGSDQTFDFEFDEDEIEDAIKLLKKHKLEFDLYSGETEALEVKGDPKKVLTWAKKVDPDTYKRYSTKDLEDNNGA